MSLDIIPVAAGEPARLMIKAWAEDHGMTLYQGREGTKFPIRRYLKNAYPCWEYVPWSGTGPAIAQIHRYIAILDADDAEARELVASWNLPEHFATRGVSYSKQVITEHHYLANWEGLKRIQGMCPGLDFLANPDEQEQWIKIWDEGYEVVSVQPEHRVPALPGRSRTRSRVADLPDHLVALHHKAAEEQRQLSASDGEVPVGQYRTEGIPHGHQSFELYRSACSLAARRSQPAEILAILTEIVEHSQTDAWDPWREGQLASMADRGYRRYGKPPIVVKQWEDEDPSLYPGGEDEGQEPEPVQEQEPEQEQPDLSRHVTAPRLRVAPPAELAEWADQVVQDVRAQVWEIAGPEWPDNPKAKDAVWGNMNAALVTVEPAGLVFGWLGDLDLIDYGRADAIIRAVVLPMEYLDKLSRDAEIAEKMFAAYFQAGWNKGATEGHEVPPHLQAALDAWHPPCPLEREGIEEHRLPGRPGRWPVENYVSLLDDRGNARRLLDHYGSRILFADGQKGLGECAYDGQRWLERRQRRSRPGWRVR